LLLRNVTKVGCSLLWGKKTKTQKFNFITIETNLPPLL